MIVLKIFILFLPLLLLAEANFGTGPFHRLPSGDSSGSPTISSNLPGNQQIPSSPQLPHLDQQPSVHVEPVSLVYTEKSVSVAPANLPLKIDTDSPIEIQTAKPGLVQPLQPLHTDDIKWDNSPYHVPRPVLRPWSPLKFPSPSVNIQKASQRNTPPMVHEEPVTPITEKSGSVDPTTSPATSEPDSTIEIQTPETAVAQKPHSFHTENINQNSGPHHVSKPASSPWRPPKFPTLAVNIHEASQPNTVKSVTVGPVSSVTTENLVSVDPATLPPKIYSDSPKKIEIPKPGLVQPLQPLHTDYIQWDSPYHVPRPVLRPWSPPKFPSPSLNIQKASQLNTPPLVHVEPVTLITTEKSGSVVVTTSPATSEPNSEIEIQTPESAVVQKPHSFHTENINQNSGPYHVSKPASSPWSPPKFPTLAVNIHEASQPNTVGSVKVEPVTSVTTEISVSVDPATLPPKIYSNSPKEIEIPKPGLVQPLQPLHIDNIQWDSPYHVPRPVLRTWSPPKFPSPSLNIQKASQPNTSPLVHVEPVTLISTEKSGSVDVTTSPATSEPTSEIEIQTPESAVAQKPHSFHTENINQNSGPYHVSKPASSPWSPPKFPTLAVNIHEASQPNTVGSVKVEPVTSVTTEISVSVDPATFPPKIYSDSPKEIKIPKPGLVQPTHPFHINNINWDNSPYHVRRPVLSPWSPPKFPNPSVNIQKASQPNIAESVHVEPEIVDTPENIVSVEPATLPQTIETDSPLEIQTPKPGVLQAPHAFHRDFVHLDSVSPYHVPSSLDPEHPNFIPRPAPSRRFPNKQNIVESVHVEPAIVVTPEKLVSVEPATLPQTIETDSPVEIQTPKPGVLQAPHAFHRDFVHRDSVSPYHVPSSLHPEHPNFISRPAPSPRFPNKQNIVESVHVEPAIVVTPEKFVSVESATLPQTIETDSPVEIQTPKPGVLQAPHAFHRDNVHRDSVSPYHVPNSLHPEPPNFILRPAPIPRFPNKPSTNSSEEILSLSKPVYIGKINRKDIGPYHRSQRSTDPWDQQISNSFEEDQISQHSIPPPALTTEHPGSNLRRFRCPQAYGYFKYTNHCGEYIECKNYIPLAYTCPAGLYFNPQAEWTEYPCDHPSNVQCDEETILLPTTSSPLANTPPPNVVTTPRPTNQKHVYVCPQAHGYFKFNDQCEQYIECKNYVPLMFSCPPGLHFNPRAQWTEYPCEHPSIVQCDSDATDGKPPRPTEAPTTRPIPAPPTTRPPPPPPSIIRSPPPPHTSRQPPPPPTTRWPPPPPPPPPSIRRPPAPPSMTSRTQQPPTTRRPPPLQPTWRPSPPKTRQTPPPPTTRPQTPPPTTTPLPVIIPGPKNPPDHNICPQQFGYFKISDQCNKYLECKNYVPLIFTCPVGLHFNPFADWTEYPCDLPSKVQCNEESVDQKVPSTTQPPPAIITQLPVLKPQPGRKLPNFKCPEANGYFKHNDKCSEYIECKNYVPITYKCPSGLHFNVFAHWTEYPCDQPSKVQCNTESGTNQPTENPNVTSRPVVPLLPTIATPEPTDVTHSPTAVTPYTPRFPTQGTARPSTERPSFELIDFDCHDPNAYYAVASQCDVYIECQSSKAIKRYCPAGLQFDSKAQWPKFPCDYPTIVQCDKEAGTKQPTKYPNVTPRPTEGTQQPAVVTPRPTVATPRSTVVTPSLPHFSTQGNVYPPTQSPSRLPVVPPRPTIVTQSPTAVTPYIPRFHTQGSVHPSTERPSFELFDYYCQEPNGYYAVASQCDTYIECKRYNAIQHFCPDGLHFNSKAQWPNFPCDYPSRVQCKNESVTDDSITRPDIGIHRPNFGFLRPTIGTPRPIIVTSRRPTGHYVTRLPRQPPVKPSPSKQPSNYSCQESNGFYSVASKCDVYVECKNGTAIEHTCPDGLLFNTNTHWPDYPCGYPSEVTCSSGDVVQQPNPTAECPHREGFFPTDSGDCGEYKVCTAGVAIIKHCPPGLVFNFNKLNTCDWPVNVPTCNRARALEGFVCPSPPVNENTLHVHKYRYGRSCKNFIACQKGHPRLLTCDAGLHFNEQTESCVDSDLVVDCDA